MQLHLQPTQVQLYPTVLLWSYNLMTKYHMYPQKCASSVLELYLILTNISVQIHLELEIWHSQLTVYIYQLGVLPEVTGSQPGEMKNISLYTMVLDIHVIVVFHLCFNLVSDIIETCCSFLFFLTFYFYFYFLKLFTIGEADAIHVRRSLAWIEATINGFSSPVVATILMS